MLREYFAKSSRNPSACRESLQNRPPISNVCVKLRSSALGPTKQVSRAVTQANKGADTSGTTDEAVATRLKELRGARPQPLVAAEVGVSLRAYQQWEAGGGIAWSNVQALAEFYGVSPQWLLNGEEPAATDPGQSDRVRASLAEILGALNLERENRERSVAAMMDLLNDAKDEWRELRLAIQVLDERLRRNDETADVKQSTIAPPETQRLDSIEAKLQALLGIALERELELAVERDDTQERDIASTHDENPRSNP